MAENQQKKTKKWSQKYKTEYSLQYPCIRKSERGIYHAFCTICSVDIKVEHGGRDDILKHGHILGNVENEEDEDHVVLERPMDTPAVVGAVYKQNTLGNYELVELPVREGPGEGGAAVRTQPSEKAMVDKLIQEYGFNQYVSDKISLDRNIADLRSQQ
nr:uncharacterized protein LOC129265200 [Lytechinus pictus]